MKIKAYNITELQMHRNNPRLIDQYKLGVLKRSIKEFPKMLELRPCIIDEDNVIICGNMRYLACSELGFDTIMAIKVKDLSRERKNELLVKDNMSYGEWDDDVLGELFESSKLEQWTGEVRIDYSFLDKFVDVEDEAKSKSERVVQAISFHLPNKFYEVKELESSLRKNHVDVGALIIGNLEILRKDYAKG